jgi:hypothetical protein
MLGMVDVHEAGIRYWLEPIVPEDMPGLATEWLAAGIGGEAVLKSASSDFMDSRDICDLFIEALKEIGAWVPSRDDAMLAYVEDFARRIAQDEGQLGEEASSFRRLIDFDDLAFGPFPHDLSVFGLMCWFYGTSAFEEQGGIERLRAAVRAVVDQ